MNKNHVRIWMLERHGKTGRLPVEEVALLKFAGRVPMKEMARGILEAREEIRKRGG